MLAQKHDPGLKVLIEAEQSLESYNETTVHSLPYACAYLRLLHSYLLLTLLCMSNVPRVKANLTNSLYTHMTIIAGTLLSQPCAYGIQAGSPVLYVSLPVSRSCICVPTGQWHRAHLPTLWRYSFGFGATWQAVLGLPTGTGNSGSQRAGQARANVTWGRALVIAAAQPSATWHITWGAVAVTASAAALMAATCLHVAALFITPEGFMAGQQLMGFPTGAALFQHGPAECGAGAMVAALCTPVPATRQQFVACGPTWRSFFVACQPLILHLPSSSLKTVVLTWTLLP